MVGILPGTLPKFDSLRRSSALLQQTHERTIDAIAGWDEKQRAYGYIGAALGLQGEK